MAKLNDRVSILNWVRAFALATLASFGLATVLKAVMVPPALSIR